MPRIAASLVIALAVAACATAPTPREAANPSPQTPARPFIERSLVIAPETVGGFRLTNMNDYPGRPDSGVGLRYAHPDFPDVRVDLFVYPMGRAPHDDALRGGMDQLRGELAAIVEQGRYAKLEYGQETAFDLDAVSADGEQAAAPPAPAPTVEPESDDPDEQAILALVAGTEAAMDTSRGLRLPLRFEHDGAPVDSLAFLFYRGLYLYKGRISTSPQAMPADSFDRFANHAMATLMPAVQVRSTGGCAGSTIFLDPDAGPEQMQKQLLRGVTESVAREKAENCAAELDTTVPPGHRALELAYPPEMWR